MQHPNGERVMVHWHFHKKLWSVSIYDKSKRGWRVVRDALGRQVLYGKVVMQDVEFVVNERKRDICRAQGVKNVHAWLVGTLLASSVEERTVCVPCGIPVVYNPLVYDRFVTAEGKVPIDYARFVAAGVDTGVLAVV